MKSILLVEDDKSLNQGIALKLSKGAVLNTRPQKGKQRKKEKGVPNLGRSNPRSKLGTPLVM